MCSWFCVLFDHVSNLSASQQIWTSWSFILVIQFKIWTYISLLYPGLMYIKSFFYYYCYGIHMIKNPKFFFLLQIKVKNWNSNIYFKHKNILIPKGLFCTVKVLYRISSEYLVKVFSYWGLVDLLFTCQMFLCCSF